jgi:hypothetical protein
MARIRLEIQQSNERVRAGMALLSNGGLALFGAFAAILYNGSGTDGALGMAILALFLICASFALSVFLREEV